jgi:hypothetical protein
MNYAAWDRGSWPQSPNIQGGCFAPEHEVQLRFGGRGILDEPALIGASWADTAGMRRS